jgi:ketosteroid isomerase-like protein
MLGSIVRSVSPEILGRLRVQERFDCWNRDELEPMLEMYAEDAVFDVSAVFTDVPPARGHADMLSYWKELRETWGGGMRTEPIEVYDLGDGRYVLDLRLGGTGTLSGMEIDQRFAFLYTFRADGFVVLAQLFPDMAAAVSAARHASRQPS